MRNALLLSLFALGCAGQTELAGTDDAEAMGGSTESVTATEQRAPGGATNAASSSRASDGGATAAPTVTSARGGNPNGGAGGAAIRQTSGIGGTTQSSSSYRWVTSGQTCHWVVDGKDLGLCGPASKGTRVCGGSGRCVVDLALKELSALDCDFDGMHDTLRDASNCEYCGHACPNSGTTCKLISEVGETPDDYTMNFACVGGAPSVSTAPSTVTPPQTCHWIVKGVDRGPCGPVSLGTRTCDGDGACLALTSPIDGYTLGLDCDFDGVIETKRDTNNCGACGRPCLLGPSSRCEIIGRSGTTPSEYELFFDCS